ncbi:MAG: hypothetical protein AB7N71_03120 [Phycisphaerae bacterium]
MPVPNNVNVTNVGFHGVDRHSGEGIDNSPWVVTVDSNGVEWASPETFAQNPNSNYLEWGTMYNFWFDADTAPQSQSVTIGLFKPGMPLDVTFASVGPESGGLIGDMNCDGLISVGDIAPFVLALTDPAGYATSFPDCDINNGDVNGDNLISVGDIGAFVALVTAG